MRRAVIIALACILAFQLSWAEAAVYCQHESGPTVTHFGHHAHRHPVNDAGGKPGKTLSKLSADQDCTACHLAGMAVPIMVFLSPPANTTHVSPQFEVIQESSSTYPHPPERPKWLPAAA